LHLTATTFEELWRRYRACRRNKRNTRNALAFEIEAEAKLLELQQELRDHTYRPGRSICFVTDGPKPREVFAADFRDRVVHHLLVHRLERVFEPRFIHDSYACRAGKGTLAASDRLMQFLRRITANGRRAAWALKLDVASFFPSIHKQTLYGIIAQHVRDPEVLWLTRAVLFHDPTRDYHFRSREASPGPETNCYPIPAHKSLFGKNNERGLPIGNLTSQFWGNVYLNELDQLVKRTLRCRYYIRYVDDMVLLSEGREQLVRWRGEIEQFLDRRLRLVLRAEAQEPVPVRRGIDFVGWKTWWNYRVPRRRTVSRLRHVVETFQRRRVRPAFGGLAQRLELTSGGNGGEDAGVAQLRASLASYAGHLRHGAAWGDWVRTWADHPWLSLLMRREGWAFAVRWPQRHPARRFRDRYAQTVRSAGDDCLTFFRVGRFIEFYGPQRLLAERVLLLRRVYLPRAGYGLAAGFPVWLAARFAQRALHQGYAVVALSHGRLGRMAIACGGNVLCQRCPAGPIPDGP
jgi:RNA-directed DNA polymerase